MAQSTHCWREQHGRTRHPRQMLGVVPDAANQSTKRVAALYAQPLRQLANAWIECGGRHAPVLLDRELHAFGARDSQAPLTDGGNRRLLSRVVRGAHVEAER